MITPAAALKILNSNEEGMVFTEEEAAVILQETYKLAEIVLHWIKKELEKGDDGEGVGCDNGRN